MAGWVLRLALLAVSGWGRWAGELGPAPLSPPVPGGAGWRRSDQLLQPQLPLLLQTLPWLPSLWCVLPIDLLQGLTFAVAYGCGTLRAKAIAPPHLRSTVQSLFFCLYYGEWLGCWGALYPLDRSDR